VSQRFEDNAFDLCLDQRRWNIFGWPDVDTAPEFAMAYTVEEINAQPDSEPDYKAAPRLQGQAQHQHEAKEDAEKREQWDHRYAKWTATVRLFTA